MKNSMEKELKNLLEGNYPPKEIKKNIEDVKSSADPTGSAEEIFTFFKKYGSEIPPII